MSSKNKNIFFCKECGNESAVWQGQCKSCGAWNSYVEAPSKNYSKHAGNKKNGIAPKPQKLTGVILDEDIRIKSNISELDAVLNGGFVSGQVILISGQPGIGKSTLLIQIADKIDKKVLYVSGEESESQIALRALRLGINNSNISLLSTGDLDEVLEIADDFDFLIIDSIQTVYSNKIESTAGSVMQIRECAYQIIDYSKRTGKPSVIVGHITKEGNIAGPKLLEHMVDSVFYLEGDKQHLFRMLRVNKNRYGDDSDVGIFEMTNSGLVEVSDASKFFRQEKLGHTSGSAVAMIIEGNRPIAVDVQALATKTRFGYPKRASNGFSTNKLTLLCAVIEKKTGIDISDYDIYVNVASGINIKEPGIDLAVCAAIMSSFYDKPIDPGYIFIGEVGLSGEIRKVFLQEKRIKESKKIGITKVFSSFEIGNIKELIPIVNNKAISTR